MNYLGDNIRRARHKKKLDQITLARALGLDQTAISRFETGSRRPSVDLLRRMAGVLSCHVAALMGMDEEEFKREEENRIKNIRDNVKVDPLRFIWEKLISKDRKIRKQMRVIYERRDELAPEDWQYISDNIFQSFRMVEALLNRKKIK